MTESNCPTCGGTGTVCKHCGADANRSEAECPGPWLRRGGEHSWDKCKTCAGTGERKEAHQCRN